MASTSQSHVGVHLVLFFVAVSWGFNNIAMKIGFQYLSAPQFNGLRLLLAFPFMLFLAFCLPSRMRFTRRDLAGIVLVGLLGLGIFQMLFPLGIDETSASLGGILMATMPAHVVILSIVFHFERAQWKSITGVLLTLIGVALIVFTSSGQENGQTTLRGILFVVTAEFGYAINTTFLKQYMKRYPPLQVTGLAMASSVLFYLAIYFPDVMTLDLSNIHPIGWLTAAYSGLIAFLLCNIVWNLSIHRIGSTNVAVYGNLPPVIVPILSALLFHDVLRPLQLVGTAVILGGVVLVQLRPAGPVAPDVPSSEVLDESK